MILGINTCRIHMFHIEDIVAPDELLIHFQVLSV